MMLAMLDTVETFAEVLRRADYATGDAGKGHLDGEPKPGWDIGNDPAHPTLQRSIWRIIWPPAGSSGAGP
jgi:arylsulfatase A-like enzyme